MRSSEARRSASEVARAAFCAWILSAASGVRSSCAASAVKRRSRAMADCTRSSSAFSASSTGSISAVLRARRIGASEPGSRRAMRCASSASGARP